MNKTKSIFLFLLLVLPVLIYLFLQAFGENRFAIPVYFEKGLPLIHKGCGSLNASGPYRIESEKINTYINSNQFNGITVYEIGNGNSNELRNNLYTFLEKYKANKEVRLVSLKSNADTSNTTSRYSTWKRYYLSDSILVNVGRCILQINLDHRMKADSGLILVDQKQQIRGYYDPFELKEIDRLNTELYILLSEE